MKSLAALDAALEAMRRILCEDAHTPDTQVAAAQAVAALIACQASQPLMIPLSEPHK